MAEHEGLERARRQVKSLGQLDLFIEQGLDALLVGLGKDRRHDEAGQEDGQRDQHRIRRALLQAQSGPQ